MPSRRPPARRARPRRPVASRTPRIAIVVLVALVSLFTLLLTAFGGGSDARTVAASTTPATRGLPPVGRPHPQVIAVHGPLRVQLPVAQTAVTAIGYHAAPDALTLDAVGRQGNQGLVGRVAARIFGTGRGGPVYFELGGDGTRRGALDVGAAPGTDVFAPVDGTIVGITPFVLDGARRGARIDVQPANAPSLVVSLTRLRPDPSLSVGATVAASVHRLGKVLDLAPYERQGLARYTQDAGNHVELQVFPAATLSLR